MSDWQHDETVVKELTAVMRKADKVFERVGGSTRHYVRDCLLPLMADAGLFVSSSELQARVAELEAAAREAMTLLDQQEPMPAAAFATLLCALNPELPSAKRALEGK